MVARLGPGAAPAGCTMAAEIATALWAALPRYGRSRQVPHLPNSGWRVTCLQSCLGSPSQPSRNVGAVNGAGYSEPLRRRCDVARFAHRISPSCRTLFGLGLKRSIHAFVASKYRLPRSVPRRRPRPSCCARHRRTLEGSIAHRVKFRLGLHLLGQYEHNPHPCSTSRFLRKIVDPKILDGPAQRTCADPDHLPVERRGILGKLTKGCLNNYGFISRLSVRQNSVQERRQCQERTAM